MWSMQTMLDKFGGEQAGRRASVGRIDTLISAHVTIFGDVRFSGGVQVDGTVNGSLIAEDQGSSLRVTRAGRVCGDIKGPNIVINGTVEGNVYASERLELNADALINGDVHYELIEMVMGAQVNGQLVHVQAEASKRIELPRAMEQSSEATAASAGASAEINPDRAVLAKKKSKVKLNTPSANPSTVQSVRAS